MPTQLIPCTVCRRSNAPWRRHCGGCGSGLLGACRCGFVNAGEDRFCGGCGMAIRMVLAETPPRAVPPRAPGGSNPNITTQLDVLDDVLISESPIGRGGD